MLTATGRLDDRALSAVAELERRVVAADGGRLKLEWDVLRGRDGAAARDLVWWSGERALGFCGIYSFGGDVELAGMVDPEHRRARIGSALLAEALTVVAAEGGDAVLLVTPRTTPAGPAFARAHGARLDHSEHHLVLDAAPAPRAEHADLVIRDARAGDLPAIRRIRGAAFGGHWGEDLPLLADERQVVVERDGTVVGCLRVSGSRSVGVYGFAVDPRLQGRGIGRTALARVCADLLAGGADRVTLEVAVDNDHALGLYTSLGFQPRATEDYFALPPLAGQKRGGSR